MFSFSNAGLPSRLLGAGVGVAMLLCGWTTTQAHAALISTGACDNSTLTQPFAGFSDQNSYKLVPGGDFEGSTAGWTFTGAAGKAPGSDPFGITGAVGKYSLNLPAGSSAESPFTCVNASDPIFRFVARNNGLLSSLTVQVVYKTVLGQISLPLGLSALSPNWSPTPPMLTGSVVGGLLSGGTAQVALRFSSLIGDSQVDDIFIDPRMN